MTDIEAGKQVPTRQVGRTDLRTTLLGLGTVAIGNFGRVTPDADAASLIDAAWNAGIRYFDTAPLYGHGLAELRLGAGLRWRPADEFVLSSKVGRILKPARRQDIDFAPWVDGAPFVRDFDYSYDGTMRAFEDSLQRMGLERMDICFIHDIDVANCGARQPEVFEQAMTDCWRALASLRDQGVVKAIGVGVNEWEVCHEALKRRDFDCFLLAGRYTLLEQDAIDSFLPLCEERGASVIVGGGFNSGILATGAVEGALYNYHPAPPEVLGRVRRIEQVCARHGVPLPAAALQFVVAHPAVCSFVAGIRNVGQLESNLAWFNASIPAGFWNDLRAEGLLSEKAPTPGSSAGSLLPA